MPDTVSPELLALQQALLGRYSIERELGRGGMGIVFLARDLALDRQVAIKLLPPALAGKADLRERFVREAQTAAKLSQPNIVPIHSVETTAGLVWFAMAYIEGETLGERLRTRGALTPQETARLVQQAAWALGYAHGRGVVHRDVKPDNIMIERGTERVVLMDFGIASLAAQNAERQVLGTAQYISPEQAAGDPVDGRADIYSLGVVAFLALSGRLPFEAPDSASLLAMHMSRPAPPVASVAPGLPRKLAQAVDRCLAKLPADRFPDGEALADSVAEAIEARRELPVPMRMWLKQSVESRVGYVAWYAAIGVPASFAAGGAVGALLGLPDLGFATGALTYLFTPPAIHLMNRLYRFRRLLESGYGGDDARYALRELAERRKEELAYEYGEPPRWAQVTRKVMMGSILTAMISTAALVGTGTGSDAVMFLASGSAITAFVTLVMQVIRPGTTVTRDPYVERRLRFWNGRMGRWFEKLARIGLKRPRAAAELTWRPTEMAIGLAADALFDSLPKEQKKELKELPPLIDRLQHDAQLMRRTVDELNGALAGLGDQSAAARSSALQSGAGAALTGTRDRLTADLTARRDQAAGKLAAAVTALETIRLNLLRLRAGTGSVAEITADLSAAREALARLDIEVRSREEVEMLLRGARASTGELRAVTPHG